MWRAVTYVTLVGLLACGEQRRYEYKTPDAVTAAVGRGWIPSCVPPSSAIEAEQNVDTNESWGVATFTDADEPSLRRQVVDWNGPRPSLRRPSSLTSWPDEMPTPDGSQRFQRCGDGDEFVLQMDWTNNRMFFARSTLSQTPTP